MLIWVICGEQLHTIQRMLTLGELQTEHFSCKRVRKEPKTLKKESVLICVICGEQKHHGLKTTRFK